MQELPGLLIAAIVAVAAFRIWKRHRARTAAAAEARAWKQTQWLRRVAEQKRIRERLVHLNDDSLSLMESMPGWVESAESHLDRADRDFAEGAFAPFWSSVERAAVALAGFDESVQKIERNSCEYIDLLARYRGAAPAFAVSTPSTTRMRLATATCRRMQGIVRRAQCDFQFSVIYEHRKTNQILVAGFRSLAEALEEMTGRITTSIDSLTTAVDTMTKTLDESLRHLAGRGTTLLAAARAGVETADGPLRERRVLEILDGIEERRYGKPAPIRAASADPGTVTIRAGRFPVDAIEEATA